MKSPGSKPIVPIIGLPILRSPGSPCPGRPTVRSEPDVSFRGHFHLTSRGPCLATVFPARRDFEGGGRCGEGIVPRLFAPVQTGGSSSIDENLVELDGFVGPKVRSVQLRFALEGEAETLDAVTEQLSPGLVRKAGGEEPLGVFVAFFPEGVTNESEITAIAYDSDGNTLGRITWVDLDH